MIWAQDNKSSKGLFAELEYQDKNGRLTQISATAKKVRSAIFYCNKDYMFSGLAYLGAISQLPPKRMYCDTIDTSNAWLNVVRKGLFCIELPIPLVYTHIEDILIDSLVLGSAFLIRNRFLQLFQVGHWLKLPVVSYHSLGLESKRLWLCVALVLAEMQRDIDKGLLTEFVQDAPPFKNLFDNDIQTERKTTKRTRSIAYSLPHL